MLREVNEIYARFSLMSTEMKEGSGVFLFINVYQFSYFTAYTPSHETFFLSFPLSFIIRFYSYMYHQYRRLKVFWPFHCIIFCVKTLRLIVVLHETIKGSYIHCLLVCLLLNVPLEIISPTWRRRHFWVCFNAYTIIITMA